MMEEFYDLTLNVGSQPKPALANLRNVLNSPRFCTLCYDHEFLRDLSEYPWLEDEDGDCSLSLREILEEIFRDAAPKIILSNYICYHCKEKVLDTYTFIQKTVSNAYNFENYLAQLDSETFDLHNCMQGDIACANAVIVLEEQKLEERPEEKFKWKSNTPIEKFISNTRPVRQVVHSNYTCEICQKEFTDKKFLMAHLKAGADLCKPPQGIPTCPKCLTKPCEHDKFIENFLEQRNAKCSVIKCLLCDYTSNTLSPLISHVDKKHIEILSDNCELCGKIFRLREQYLSHFETFHEEYKICQYCYGVIPKVEYRSHARQCKNTEKLNTCDLCPAKFESELQATIHTMKHDEMPKKPKKRKIILKRSYSCPLCPMKFDGKIKLQKHASKTHANVSYKNNLCQFCDIKFETRQEYLLHMRQTEHMAEIDPTHKYRHKCQYCDYTARHSFILKTHVNHYHLKVMPFQCDICHKRFLDKRKVKAHIDRHMGTDKRICDICGDTLGSSTALTKHKRLHTGERPYPCQLCDARLNSASERKFHVLSKHTEKSHPCPLCDSMFHTPYFVRRHIQSVHWKRKDKKFDYTKVEGLQPEHYELFRDRRMLVL